MRHLSFGAPLDCYGELARELLAAQQAGDAQALRLIHSNHPRFLDEKIPRLEKRLTPEEIQQAPFDMDDARLVVARCHGYRDWACLASHLVTGDAAFESAVEALIAGDAATVRGLLAGQPALIHTRSTRVTHFDPPVHGAMLLHYLASNGVEGHRQKSPANAVEMAEILFDAGADPNALAYLYGGECTTLSLLVSSTPPAEAGVQGPLVESLLDHGATLEPLGQGNWTSPLITALVFGFADTAELLASRGARVDSLAAAAGLGRTEQVKSLLPGADTGERHRAMALAAQLGRAEAAALLLEAGEDPNRCNPPGFHAHATPLHHAALNGHFETARLLVKHGARLDIADTFYRSTPIGWAEHGGHAAIAEYLRSFSRS